MNILTVDVEEWFHLLDNNSTKTYKEWSQYESRIQANMERIFAILEQYNQKATFFCLGWIAEKYPEIIRKIANKGYEIGSHTRMHQLIYEQSPLEFKKDIEHSIKTLEDITGNKIKYFRAPGFSIKKENTWAFEIIAEQGIEVDSSIFPVQRSHGGLPNYTNPLPSVIKYQGITLKELPINYARLMGMSFIFTGGGYFRLFPYSLIKKWTKESDYIMSYVHPRDFDAKQPMIKDLSLFRKFKSYYGLRTSEDKFRQWLSDFKFIDIGTAVNQIDWENAPIVNL